VFFCRKFLQNRRFNVKIINTVICKEVGNMIKEAVLTADQESQDQNNPSKEACEIIACTLLNRYLKERDADREIA
jgi:hypothetical protein